MKRIFIFLLLIGSVITAHAQFGGSPTITGKISGTIIDSVTKKPVQYASVAIYYSNGTAPVNGMITDEKGSFKLYNIKPNSYKVVITFVGGYLTKTINPVVTTLSKPDNNMGTILIKPDNGDLGEVKVTGQSAVIENHIDKIVYNADKDITNVGGNASDVLQKVPLVSVDINGNVSLRGDPNVKVLINGRPSGAMAASLSDVLKTIPADQIKSIEVITSPSAKYDAEGSAGILNIITKQSNVSGFNGGISGGVGTRQNNENINVGYNKNRLSISANSGGNLTWPQTSITNFDQNFNNADGHEDQSFKRTSDIKRYGTISSITASYDINNYNNINSTFRYNRGGFNVNGSQTDSTINYLDPSKNLKYSNTTAQHNLFDGFDWVFDYLHKFKKEGHTLDLSAQWSHSIVNTDYTNIYNGVLSNQRGINDGKNDEYTLQADYTLPISKLLKLEAGGKTIFRKLSSDFEVYDADLVTLDAANSNVYDYNQNVYAGYTVLTFTLPKNYSILAGARFENTAINGEADNIDEGLLPVNQNYNIFIPSFTIQKQVGTTQTWKLSYSKRITRPSFTLLNPFVNMANVQSQTEGNPNLSPEVSQTVELNYNTFIGSSVINASVFYRHINNEIESLVNNLPPQVVNGDTLRGTITNNENVGTNHSWGVSFFGSINPIKPLTIRGSATAFTYDPVASGDFSQFQTQNGTYIQYNVQAMAEYDFKHNWVAQVFTFDNSPRRTIQGVNPTFSLVGFGVRKQFDNKKASLGLNVLQPFNKYKYFDQNITGPGLTQTSSTAFPFRSVGLTFSYSFGKLTFSNPKQKDLNEDEKQGDQGIGGGNSPGR